jgi:hypothetical protein
MSNVKNRGADAAPKTATEETISLTRLANIGELVATAKGEVRIKEPSLEQVLELLTYLIPLASGFQTNASDGKGAIIDILKGAETRDAIKKIAVALSDKDEEFFTDLGITDWLKVIVTVKKVVNWDELQQLFFQLDLGAMLNQIQSQ